jgi:chlorobactene glucosyltransferase
MDMPWIGYFAVAAIALSTQLLIASHNLRRFRRLGGSPWAGEFPAVSILIPARNEAETIAESVRAILSSDYPSVEVIVLDDGSDDQTALIARTAGANDARLRVESGAPLPAGWFGKPWACRQLADLASHDIFVFTDADVSWRPGALRAAVVHFLEQRADLLSVFPTQVAQTLGERLFAPMLALVLHSLLPIGWVEDRRMISAAAANGQCMIFTRSAYRRIGGHQVVSDQAVEDVMLARAIKQAGLALRLVAGGDLMACRMYRSVSDAVHGYARSLLAGHGDSVVLLSLSVAAMVALYVVPWIWFASAIWSGALTHIGLSATLILLGLAIRGLTGRIAGMSHRADVLLPVSITMMAVSALVAVYSRLVYGGTEWRGRRLARQRHHHGSPQEGGRV